MVEPRNFSLCFTSLVLFKAHVGDRSTLAEESKILWTSETKVQPTHRYMASDDDEHKDIDHGGLTGAFAESHTPDLAMKWVA